MREPMCVPKEKEREREKESRLIAHFFKSLIELAMTPSPSLPLGTEAR